MLEIDDDKYYIDNKELPKLHADLQSQCVNDNHQIDRRPQWTKNLFDGIEVTKIEWLSKECAFQNISTGCFTLSLTTILSLTLTNTITITVTLFRTLS